MFASDRFIKSLVTCCMEVVVFMYKMFMLVFLVMIYLMGIYLFDLVIIIEFFVCVDMSMSREI